MVCKLCEAPHLETDVEGPWPTGALATCSVRTSYKSEGAAGGADMPPIGNGDKRFWVSVQMPPKGYTGNWQVGVQAVFCIPGTN